MSTALREDLLFWLHHAKSWNGTQRWRAESEPVVLASDASTSGFGWILERAPQSVCSRLPEFMGPGHAVAGYWDSDLRELQSSSANIGWGELFVPLAAVRRMGPALKNSHIVFALDNAGDVEVINRRRIGLRLLVCAPCSASFVC